MAAMDPPLQKTLASHPSVKLRTTLPKVQQEPKVPTLLSMMSGFIAKEINQPLPTPVALAEPSSELFKRAEDIEYSELLDEAAEHKMGSLERLLKVAAYALSPYGACHADRVFKPLLAGPNETLEAVYPAKGVRYLAESIHDHAWVVATHMEGRKWTLATDDQYKPKLWGTSLDFIPNWWLELTFHDGEIFTWTKGITSVNNILAGEMFVAHRGQLRITQKSASRVAVIKFKEPGVVKLSTKGRKTANRPVRLQGSKPALMVTGYIEEKGEKLASPRFVGFWDSHLDAVFDGKETKNLWKIHPLPKNDSKFQMPYFMIGLTDLPAAVKPLLPLTDSRLRTDIKLVENGIYDKAGEEKEAHEQRMHAIINAAKEKTGKPFIKPNWFTRTADSDQIKPGEGIRWRYNHQYWAARASGFENEKLCKSFAGMGV